jgi:peptide/nickel transport system substrate-binding protein
MVRSVRSRFISVRRLDVALTAAAAVCMLTIASAQPLTWPPEYAPTVEYGGTIVEPTFSDITTLNPYFAKSSTEVSILGMMAGPGFLYRDWLGTRAFRNEAGEWNLYWASDVEELDPDRDYIVTIREGWTWSDGTPISMDDVVAARVVHGDPEAQSNSFVCTVVGDEPVAYEVLDERRIRITLPVAQVNALAIKDCGTIPAHVFMPVYEESGGAAAAGHWGTATPVSEIVSGGPYQLVEYRPGERLVFERNPTYTFELAADGSELPGPDRWTVTIAHDQNAQLAQVLTGAASFYWPRSLDQVRAVQQAVSSGTIGGTLYPNLSPGTSVDFVSYNFNNTDACKAEMFREPRFRRAMSLLMDREAMVEGAVGGLGFPANDWTTVASAPFDPSFMGPLEFDPEEAVRLLRSLGFTQTGSDGVLRNPATGCRVEFDLQFNSGNVRRPQLALIFSQTASEYGVRVNPREVSVEIWGDSISGTGMPRTVDYDAQIWAFGGGDVDNPAATNVLRINASLNSWNKDPENVEPFEVLMDQLTVAIDGALDLDERVALYRQRAEVMRDYLPITPMIAPSFHFYENVGNTWPVEAFDALSILEPYRPGAFRTQVMAP